MDRPSSIRMEAMLLSDRRSAAAAAWNLLNRSRLKRSVMVRLLAACGGPVIGIVQPNTT